MKNCALLFLILLIVPLAFAASYTSVQSGDFNTNSTWGTSSHPQAGDTWTVSSGTTVTCSGVCASGLSSSACSADGTVKGGGTLSIGAGATLTHSGTLNVEHNGTLNVFSSVLAGPKTGTLVIAPGAGASCKLNFVNTGTGSPNFNLVGTGGPPGLNAYAMLVCNTALHGGTACSVTPEAGGANVNVFFTYFNVVGFGNSSTRAFVTFSANSVSIANGLFDHNADVQLNIGTCSTCSFKVQNVSFTNPVDGNNTVFEFYGMAAQSGGVRSVQNLTAANRSQSQRYNAYLSMPGLQTGQSVQAGDAADINGFIGYNVTLVQSMGTSLSQKFRNSGVVLDLSSGSPNCYALLYNAGTSFQDSFCLSRTPNQHEIVAVSSASGGTANLYQRYLCDGDGFNKGDAGDMVQDWGTYTMENSLGVNRCGTMTTISNGSTEVATVTQNTNYNNYGETYCETACYDGVHPTFTNNLIVRPADIDGSGVRGDDGVHAAGTFVRQTNFSMDNNGFYQMPGSGDSGAESQPPNVPALLPNPALGGIISYVNVPASGVGGQINKPITTVIDSTHIACSSCNFTQSGSAGVMPGDYFEDNALKAVVTVASVTDSTHLVLNTGISGMHTNDLLSILTSYWNHSGWVYGDSHNGSHDIHADPEFVDSSRTLCGWYKAEAGASLSCPTYGSTMSSASHLIASSGTTGTTLVCATCDFLANGITTADVVQVFNVTSDSARGWSNISAVSTTTLTLTSAISGMMSGDVFDFITSTQGLGKMLVQSAGFDWTGTPVTPPTWATVANGMSYMYTGFTPQNPIYGSAGRPEDGFPDIGAVPVRREP